MYLKVRLEMNTPISIITLAPAHAGEARRGKEPVINKGSNLAGSFARWLRCSLVCLPKACYNGALNEVVRWRAMQSDLEDVRLLRASPPGEIPAPSCYLYLLPAPNRYDADGDE